MAEALKKNGNTLRNDNKENNPRIMEYKRRLKTKRNVQ